MTWLTWRQFRTQGVVTALALTLAALALALTGLQLTHLHNINSSADGFLTQVGSGTYGTLYYAALAAVIALPAIIGAFWGAPLVAHELDAGTHRLVWNQTVSRT